MQACLSVTCVCSGGIGWAPYCLELNLTDTSLWWTSHLFHLSIKTCFQSLFLHIFLLDFLPTATFSFSPSELRVSSICLFGNNHFFCWTTIQIVYWYLILNVVLSYLNMYHKLLERSIPWISHSSLIIAVGQFLIFLTSWFSVSKLNCVNYLG